MPTQFTPGSIPASYTSLIARTKQHRSRKPIAASILNYQSPLHPRTLQDTTAYDIIEALSLAQSHIHLSNLVIPQVMKLENPSSQLKGMSFDAKRHPPASSLAATVFLRCAAPEIELLLWF